MSLPRFIDIDGRRYLWRDLVALRQAQALPRAEAADPVRIARGSPPAGRAQRRRAVLRTEPVLLGWRSHSRPQRDNSFDYRSSGIA
jgi:hypothetical protein